MHVNTYFDKLRTDAITLAEYNQLHGQCIRLVKKACRRYRIDEISFNGTSKELVYSDVCLKALLKSLDHFDPNKGSFSTFFYYKALSASRVEVGKLKRRMKIDSTVSFDESFYRQD